MNVKKYPFYAQEVSIFLRVQDLSMLCLFIMFNLYIFILFLKNVKIIFIREQKLKQKKLGGFILFFIEFDDCSLHFTLIRFYMDSLN